MGADTVVVLFGLRFVIAPAGATSGELIAQLEEQRHPHQVRARAVGLQTYFGRATDGSEAFLLVGKKVGSFGVEGTDKASIREPEFAEIARSTREKLRGAGFTEEPALHVQLDAHY